VVHRTTRIYPRIDMGTISLDPRYKGRSYDEIESDLQSEYGRRYPKGAWEKMKDAVRYGWDKVTGKAQATGR
jgi:hypothetical protein